MNPSLPLFYHDLGRGNPPLVILHGFLGMSDNWITLGKMLAPDFHVIIPDLRNHGRSPHADQFGFSEMASDILTLINSLGYSEVNLLGHSMGGRLAMMLAVDFPEKVHSCEVVDMSPFSLPEDTTHLLLLRLMQDTDLSRYRAMSEIEQMLRKTLDEERLVMFCMKNIHRISPAEYAWKPNVNVLIDQSWKLKQSISKEKSYNGEVMFLKGECSPYFKLEEWPEILKIFPFAAYRVIENAGHWVHSDAPAAFYKETHEFLSRKKF